MSSAGAPGQTGMTDTPHEGRIDRRYSDSERPPSDWADAERALADAELYWFTSVRADGRPHVAPMVGVWHEGAFHFSTVATCPGSGVTSRVTAWLTLTTDERTTSFVFLSSKSSVSVITRPNEEALVTLRGAPDGSGITHE